MPNRLDLVAERARREQGLPPGTSPLVDPLAPHPVIAASRYEARDTEDPLAAAALDQAGIGTWALDLDARLFTLSRRCLALLNVPAARDVPRAPIHRADAAAAREAVRGILEGRHSGQAADFRVQQPDGSWAWRRLRARAVAGGIAGTVQDVTADRDRAARAEADRAFLDSIYNGVQQAMFVVDVGRDGVFRLRSTNTRHATLTGLTTAMVAGRTPHEIAALPPESADHIVERFRACVELGDVYEYEECLVVEGAESWWVTRLTPVRDANGAVVRLIGAATDETDRRLAERGRAALQRNLQASQRLESLGVLAGGVAHEFNNILTTILGTVDLVRDDLDDAPSAQEDLATIEQAARDAADLCRQLLAYSGQGRFRTEATVLSSFVAERQALLRLSAGATARLDLDLRGGTARVAADPSQLAQVVLNLVVNAAEAATGARDPAITVSTDVVQVTDEHVAAWGLSPEVTTGAWAVVSVRDAGAGMDAETRARVFEPFFTTRFTGRGLGLSAVQGIVRGHGGHVGVESTPGAGTTVRVLLPLLEGASPAPGDTHALPTLRVLLVDDEPLVRRTAARIFRRCGAEVVEAVGANEALQRFEAEGPFGLLVSDLVMPGRDGAALAEELRARAPDLKVVLCSGYDDRSLSRRADAAQADAWLAKPFRLAEARKLVDALFPPAS